MEDNYKTVFYKSICPINDCEDGTIFQSDTGQGGCWSCSYCKGKGYIIEEEEIIINNHLSIYGLFKETKES